MPCTCRVVGAFPIVRRTLRTRYSCPGVLVGAPFVVFPLMKLLPADTICAPPLAANPVALPLTVTRVMKTIVFPVPIDCTPTVPLFTDAASVRVIEIGPELA